MSEKTVFNITICVFGIIIFLIHIVNVLMKKDRRKDENILLGFFIFTAIHLAIYLAFTFIKEVYTSDPFIMAFYSSFYVMNNIEVFLLFYYLLSYANVPHKIRKITEIINISIFAIYLVLIIINIFTHIFFKPVDGVYTRSRFMIFSQGYQFIMFVTIFLVSLANKQLNIREKIAFFLYCLFPFVAIILQNMLPGFAIAYMSIIITTEILVLFLNVSKNIKIKEEEKKIEEAYIKIMMSQIQPHFIYNTLSSISTLITIDPNKAKKALDEFTEYLRMNFSSLTDDRCVPFENELKHVETYISLEQMRFNERLNVIYDIKSKSFNVPPLSIQPLVENAIKHGILQKIEGGTLTTKSYEEDKCFVVEVIDDGVGFDMESIDFSDNEHLGLSNIRSRLTTMCKGELIIDSHLGQGTKVVVKFYK